MYYFSKRYTSKLQGTSEMVGASRKSLVEDLYIPLVFYIVSSITTYDIFDSDVSPLRGLTGHTVLPRWLKPSVYKLRRGDTLLTAGFSLRGRVSNHISPVRDVTLLTAGFSLRGRIGNHISPVRDDTLLTAGFSLLGRGDTLNIGDRL